MALGENWPDDHDRRPLQFSRLSAASGALYRRQGTMNNAQEKFVSCSIIATFIHGVQSKNSQQPSVKRQENEV